MPNNERKALVGCIAVFTFMVVLFVLWYLDHYPCFLLVIYKVDKVRKLKY